MTQPLLKLADRCSKEAPSRQLDRAIASGLGYQIEVIEIPEGHPMADVFKAGSGLEFMYRPGCDREAIPPYTASIDAAMTIVPSHCAWQVQKDINYEAYGLVYGHNVHCDCNGKTPALALCAAALRARASETPADERDGGRT